MSKLNKMIVEFSVANFRSIKKKQTFSLVAETTKSKRESNSFEIEGPSKIRLLRSAVMYGANASGKSNFIKAFQAFRTFIVSSGRFEANEPIFSYNPFLFDIQTREDATEFECTFIGSDKIRYDYSLSYNGRQVVKEELNFYPKQIKKNIYKRQVDVEDSLSDIGKFNIDDLPGSIKVFKNQAILSKFGREIPHDHLTQIYLYFSNWRIWDTSNTEGLNFLMSDVISFTIPQRGENFFLKLERLIRAADTKVNGLILREDKERGDAKEVGTTLKRLREAINRLFGKHSVYNGNDFIEYYELPFNQESSGTKVLFALGALILDAIEKGSAVIFDELDNSLHPKLSRFLVQIFNNEKHNLRNAQIIFTTHEANLMDKDIFRSDQIWFAEKGEEGATEIYSAQDFEGVREDIPFEKWYLAGKFGAIPHPKDIDYIFGNGEAEL